jgi:hypothetical protein
MRFIIVITQFQVTIATNCSVFKTWYEHELCSTSHTSSHPLVLACLVYSVYCMMEKFMTDYL